MWTLPESVSTEIRTPPDPVLKLSSFAGRKLSCSMVPIPSPFSIPPLNDALLGFKYRLPDDCDPALEDCWRPRVFNEATWDSMSYWGTVTSLNFFNDNSGADIFRQLLPSGVHGIERLNAVSAYPS